VSNNFIGYSERSRGYKFYDPTIKPIFELGIATFFEDVEFRGRNKVRDIVFEKELVSIPTTTFDSVQASIPVIVREADMESQQDNVEQLPTQAEVIVLKEQTQQPQEQMPLRRSTREEKCYSR